MTVVATGLRRLGVDGRRGQAGVAGTKALLGTLSNGTRVRSLTPAARLVRGRRRTEQASGESKRACGLG